MIYDYETPEFLQQSLDQLDEQEKSGTCSHCINLSRIEIYKKLKELDIEPYNKMENL